MDDVGRELKHREAGGLMMAIKSEVELLRNR